MEIAPVAAAAEDAAPPIGGAESSGVASIGMGDPGTLDAMELGEEERGELKLERGDLEAKGARFAANGGVPSAKTRRSAFIAERRDLCNGSGAQFPPRVTKSCCYGEILLSDALVLTRENGN